MKLKEIKRDWWLANSIILFVSAAYILISKYIAGNVLWGLFSGGINALMGVALLMRSKVIFWFLFVMVVYNSLRMLLFLRTDLSQLYTVGFLINVVMLLCILMLWQQIRTERKK